MTRVMGLMPSVLGMKRRRDMTVDLGRVATWSGVNSTIWPLEMWLLNQNNSKVMTNVTVRLWAGAACAHTHTWRPCPAVLPRLPVCKTWWRFYGPCSQWHRNRLEPNPQRSHPGAKPGTAQGSAFDMRAHWGAPCLPKRKKIVYLLLPFIKNSSLFVCFFFLNES